MRRHKMSAHEYLYFTATIYSKREPEPLGIDKSWPDGCVGISFGHLPSLTLTELKQIISDLQDLADKMEG
jgi:hypothetical protein